MNLAGHRVRRLSGNYFEPWNSAEIVFVDEDDFPLANLMEHVQSDDDLDNDFELIQDEEEAAETPNRTLRVPRGRRNENTEWRRNINLRPDLDFDQPTGPRIELEEDIFYRRIVESYSGPDQFIRRAKERA